MKIEGHRDNKEGPKDAQTFLSTKMEKRVKWLFLCHSVDESGLFPNTWLSMKKCINLGADITLIFWLLEISGIVTSKAHSEILIFTSKVIPV